MSSLELPGKEEEEERNSGMKAVCTVCAAIRTEIRTKRKNIARRKALILQKLVPNIVDSEGE